MSTRILAAGALATVCATGGVLVNAQAAMGATSAANASFTCNSGDCTAPLKADGGSASPPTTVSHGETVSGNAQRAGDRAVDAQERPVSVTCKAEKSDGSKIYGVAVGQDGWKGVWAMDQADLASKVDDSALPQCSLTHKGQQYPVS
jgi:hypothetical protein